MANFSLGELILIATLIFMLAPAFIVVYIITYNKRKMRHIEEKERLQTEFRQELLKTQIEIQEQTLSNISLEIHDNITQVLSFVKLSLALTDGLEAAARQQKIAECRELVAQTITDLRYLSKSLSFEYISNYGLLKTIENEADRINKSGLIMADVTITGDPQRLDEKSELVLFRIFQEALNNTLKYANAKYFYIKLEYSEQLFILTLADDGIGFSDDILDGKAGSGLMNIQNRAKLIEANATIESWPGNGCKITISLNPLTQQQYSDGTHPDSPR